MTKRYFEKKECNLRYMDVASGKHLKHPDYCPCKGKGFTKGKEILWLKKAIEEIDKEVVGHKVLIRNNQKIIEEKKETGEGGFYFNVAKFYENINYLEGCIDSFKKVKQILLRNVSVEQSSTGVQHSRTD